MNSPPALWLGNFGPGGLTATLHSREQHNGFITGSYLARVCQCARLPPALLPPPKQKG